MSKKVKEDPQADSAIVYVRPVRMVVPVTHRDLSDEIETVQGKEQTIKSLYDSYVAGTLDPRTLGGGSFDEEGSDEVDPLNTLGLTFEEASQIEDAGRHAAKEIKQRKNIADHPRESSKHEAEEKPREGGEGEN